MIEILAHINVILIIRAIFTVWFILKFIEQFLSEEFDGKNFDERNLIKEMVPNVMN
jgi:hypothetical protein